MLAVYISTLHGLWLCSLVRRSSFRCEVAFSPSSLQKACLCMCIHNCTSREPAYLLQGKRVCLVQPLNEGLMHGTGLPLSTFDIEI
jgi:hypothetical protein